MASVFYYLFFLLFTILCFIPFALLYVLTVKFDRERVVLHRVSRIWSMGIYRLCPLWRLKVAGREKIDRGKAYVIVTNHQSMLDVPLMYFRLGAADARGHCHRARFEPQCTAHDGRG